MSPRNLPLTLDTDEERVNYFSETSTVIVAAGASLSAGILSVPRWPGAFVPVTAAVDIEGTVYVYTTPTQQWLTIYPSIQPGPSLDILEDLDIPFKPKSTRRARGIVVRRRKATFKTAFDDDLVEEMNAGK